MITALGAFRPVVEILDPLDDAIISTGSVVPINVLVKDDDTLGNEFTTEFYWSHTGLLGDAVLLGTTTPTVLTGKITSVASEVFMLALLGVVAGDVASREDLNGAYFFYDGNGPSNQAQFWKRLENGTRFSVDFDTGAVIAGKPGKIFARASDGTAFGEYDEVIVTLNDPPSAVTILTPTAGQRFFDDDPITLTWTPATDSDGPDSEIRYLIRFSLNGGATYQDVPGIPFTAKGATSYVFDPSPYNNFIGMRLQVTAYDGFSLGAPVSVGFSFGPEVTSITPTPAISADIETAVQLEATVEDPDTPPSDMFVEYIWSPSGTLGAADDQPIGNSANGEPYPLSWDTTSFVEGSGRIFARAHDPQGQGPWFSIPYQLLAAHQLGDATLVWLDPETGNVWAEELWRWYNSQYNPWEALQHGFEEFGTITNIRQPIEANPRFGILTGRGDGIPDDVIKRIIGRRSGIDKSRPWHKARVIFTDLYKMIWEVRIHKFVPIYEPGHALPSWWFEFGIVEVPDEILTPIDTP